MINQKSPKVSIILPCYNIEKYLERCVKSILRQTYENFEALFINDGSTDNIIESFNNLKLDSRFRIYTKKNEGSGVARNYGLNLATGDYVYFMDPDDRISSTLIEHNIEHILKNDADINLFGYQRISSRTNDVLSFKPAKAQIIKTPEKIRTKLSLISQEISILAVWNKFFDRNFLIKYNLKFSNLKIGQDAEFSWKVFDAAETVAIIPEVYYFYYDDRPGSARTEYNKEQFISEKKVLNTMEFFINKWEQNRLYKNMINDYKLSIVSGEIVNLRKKKNYSFENLIKDPIYKDVKKMKYKDVGSIRQKIKLLIIKNKLLLKLL